MSLQDISFLPFYNSKINNIIEDFYVPALSNCKVYKRVSAYFDSKILSLYSIGLENIIKQNGHIFFIFSSEISENDFEMMKKGYESREKIEKGLLREITVDNPTIELSNLAFLIEHGYVDIKIAFTKKGIVHDKYGLIEDGKSVLYFRGSNNETAYSVQNNMESFETSLSWNNDRFEREKIDNAIKQFDKLWNDDFPDVLVINIPDVVRDKLVSYSKGRLVFSYENKNNTFIFDIDSQNHLTGFNNLDDPSLMLPPNFWYVGYLSALVINNPSTDDKIYNFSSDLSYLDMKNIINLVIERGDKKGFDIYVAPKLRNYIFKCDIKAEKRRSLGIAIKQKETILTQEFNHFKKVLSDSMIRKLREPQLWDAFHIVNMIRSANFSVPGAGKTSIVYGAFAYLYHKKEIDNLVVIGPINSFLAWKNEFVLNFGYKLPLNVYDYQEKRYRDAQERFDGITYETNNCNLILFNYESLPANMDAIKRIIGPRTLLVFDEVHRVKSIDGERAKACLEISKKAKYKVVLSGTPIPNGYLDIHNFLKILFPDEYKTLFNYDIQFLKSANKDSQKRNRINDDIYPFFCRTTKDDLHIPPPEDDDITTGYVSFGEDYDRILSYIYRECQRSTLLLYIRLMQASTNPSLVLNKITLDDLHSFDTELDSNDFVDMFGGTVCSETYSEDEKQHIRDYGMTEKYYRGLNLIKYLVESRNQVVVWEIFVDTIEKTCVDLTKLGIKCGVIYGSVPIIEREQLITDFINKKYDVLITNPHTMAESVSLHRNCHHAVYMEYSFNLVHMLQSRDRIHRLGLEPNDKTYYHYMILDNPKAFYNTIDMKIYNRLKAKEDLQTKAVEGNDLIYIEDDMKKDIDELLGDILNKTN